MSHDNASLTDLPPSYYETESAPAYHPPTRPQSAPPLDFHLRQIGSRTQSLVAAGEAICLLSSDTEIVIKSKVSGNFSRSRPDLVLFSHKHPQRIAGDVVPPGPSKEVSEGRRLSRLSGISRVPKPQSSEPDGADLSDSDQDDNRPGDPATLIAAAWSVHTGGFPWIPRARMTYTGEGFNGIDYKKIRTRLQEQNDNFRSVKMEMQGQQQSVWATEINGVYHQWHVAIRPLRLVLIDCGARDLTMRAFLKYGETGTRARPGQDVGTLTILQDTAAIRNQSWEDFAKEVICSMAVVTLHWRAEGKYLANPVFGQ